MRAYYWGKHTKMSLGEKLALQSKDALCWILSVLLVIMMVPVAGFAAGGDATPAATATFAIVGADGSAATSKTYTDANGRVCDAYGQQVKVSVEVTAPQGYTVDNTKSYLEVLSSTGAQASKVVLTDASAVSAALSEGNGYTASVHIVCNPVVAEPAEGEDPEGGEGSEGSAEPAAQATPLEQDVPYAKTFSVCTTAPTVTVVTFNQKVVATSDGVDYFNNEESPLTATVHVKGVNLDVAKSTVSAGKDVKSWTAVGDGYEATVAVSDDANHTLTASLVSLFDATPIAVSYADIKAVAKDSAGKALAGDEFARDSSTITASITAGGKTPAADGTVYLNKKDLESGSAEVVYTVDSSSVALDDELTQALCGEETIALAEAGTVYQGVKEVSAEDATYAASINATTVRGKSASAAATIIADVTDPEVSIVFKDVVGSRDGKKIQSATVEVTVADANLGSAAAATKVYLVKEEIIGSESITNPTLTWTGDTGSFKLEKKGKYKIYAEVTDAAGNKVTTPKKEITVDTDAPEIVVSVSPSGEGAQGYEQGGLTYFKDAAIATVSIKDENIEVSANEDGTYAIADAQVTIDSVTAENVSWTSQDGKYVATFDLSKEGRGSIAVEATDAAGNKGTGAFDKYVIDADQPTVKIQVAADWMMNSSSAGKSVDYLAGENVNLATFLSAIVTEKNVKTVTATVNGKKYDLVKSDGKYVVNDKGAAVIAEGEEFTVSVTVVDVVGNTTTYNYGQTDLEGCTTVASVPDEPLAVHVCTGSAFVYDKTAPEVTVTLSEGGVSDGQDSPTYFYNKSVVATIVVKDNSAQFDESSATITVNPADYSAYEQSGWSQKLDGDKVVGWEKTITFNGETIIDPCSVVVVVTDRSGNTNQAASKAFKIDETDPEINVAFTSDPVENNVYSDVVDATITVKDRNFNPSKSTPKVAGNYEVVGDGWTNAGVDEDGVTTWTYEIQFDESQKNSLKLTANDWAGNKSESSVDTFIVDKTKPVVSVKLDNEPFDNNGEKDCYDRNVSAVITVTDKNFKPEASAPVLSGSYEMVQDWTAGDSDADGNVTWTCEVAFTESQNNSLQVTAVDYAGYTDSASVEAFIIDLTKPVVSIVPACDGDTGYDGTTMYYGDVVTTTVTVIDKNFDPAGITNVALTGNYKVTQGWTAGETDANGNVIWTYVVEFDESQDNSIAVQAYDWAGYSGSAAVKTFVVDMTDPDIAISLSPAAADGNNGTCDFYKQNVTATITVKDKNFNPSESEPLASGAYTVKQDWTAGDADSDGVVTWTYVVEYDESQANDLFSAARDWAGNGESDSVEAFIIDKTAPKVSYKINQSKIDSLNGVDYFSNIATGATEALITVTVKDKNFNPNGATKVSPAGDKYLPNKYQPASWKLVSAENGVETWEYTMAFAEGAGNAFEATVADWATNAVAGKYGSDTKPYTKDAAGKTMEGSSFVVDLTAPTVVSATTSTEEYQVYGEDEIGFYEAKTTMTVNIADNMGLYSVSLGNKNTNYSIANEVTPGAKTAQIKVALKDGVEFTDDIILNTVDMARNKRTWSISPEGTVVDVTASTTDNTSLNDEGEYRGTLVQDTVAPVLAFSGVQAGSFLKNTATVKLSVNELNFRYLKAYDPDQVVITVHKIEGDDSAAESSYTVPVSSFVASDTKSNPVGLNGEYSYTASFATDGHYSMTANLVDPAGHVGTASLGTFTVDKTAPVLSVSFDNNDALNGKYYKAGRTATVTVVEHNFDANRISIDTTGAVGAWRHNGDVHTLVISYQSDGVYNLNISGSDKADNVMNGYESGEFVVDQVAPAVNITVNGQTEQRAFNGEVVPAIEFTDEANFDPNAVTYTLTGNKTGQASYSAGVSESSNGQVVTWEDFERIIEVDDVYTLTASMTDYAGNSAEGEFTFSVNRFGSNYIIVDEKAYTENNGYLTEARDVVVQEINVSGCLSDSFEATVTRGVDTKRLTQNSSAGTTGFTVATNNNDYGWAVNTFTVAKGNFDTDGVYHVVVNSVDVADNVNTNMNYYNPDEKKSDDAQVNFSLDTTDPVIAYVNVEEGAIYTENEYQVRFNAIDNIGIAKVEVSVNGLSISDVKNEGEGNYSFAMPAASYTDRSMTIVATDVAGRTATYQVGKFNVTTDILELYLPGVVAGCIAALAAVGGLVFFLVRRKKKNEEQ